MLILMQQLYVPLSEPPVSWICCFFKSAKTSEDSGNSSDGAQFAKLKSSNKVEGVKAATVTKNLLSGAFGCGRSGPVTGTRCVVS